jgi:hypothetical protein
MKTKIKLFLIAILLVTNHLSAQKKWFPGHYVNHNPDDYTTSNSDLSFLKSADGAVFQGMFMYVTWGQIETTKDTYRWDKIDAVLNALPPGKKLAVSLSWQGWSKLQACPADMIDKVEFDGGQYIKKGLYPFATIYMTSTMNRYLDFVKKFAERYDTVQKLAFVTTAEIPFENEVKGPQFNLTTARANIFRLPSEFIPSFKKTPSGILGAWWSFGDNTNAESQFVEETTMPEEVSVFPMLCVWLVRAIICTSEMKFLQMQVNGPVGWGLNGATCCRIGPAPLSLRI